MLTIAITLLSVMINVIVVLPYVKPYSKKIRDKYFPLVYYSIDTPDSVVLRNVLETTINYNGIKMSTDEQKGLLYDLRSFFSPKRGTQDINTFYTSYALVGASYYAMCINDSNTMFKIRTKANNYINSTSRNLNYDIKAIDQAPIGILFLNLYKYFKDDMYLDIAKNIYMNVINMRQSSIIKYKPMSDCQYVDVLGMYVPFFMEYFDATKDSLAYNIVDYNMEEYYKYGVNKETGLPSHGYNLKNKVLVGSANWGRGIGWYLLAAAYCPQFNDNILDSTLTSLKYTQYVGSYSNFDSSTALMFEIFKQSKDKSRKLSLDFIKSHILKNGFVDHCSGDTYGFNGYSHTFGESELCNGLLLILSSKFKN